MGDGNRSLSISDLKVLKSLHKPLGEPTPDEWRASQHEKGQSFSDYVKNKPVCPSPGHDKVYIRLIGTFNDIDYVVINKVAAYISVFYNLKTIVLDTISDSVIPENARRLHYENEQLQSTHILFKVLKPDLPKDAIAFIAITNKDLYPKQGWNYVFGQASLKERVGVVSLFRYKYDDLDSTNSRLYLKRLMKTTTHELGHMISVKHCQKYECLMNGSMSLTEADGKPLWLCPECLAKMIWCTQYDIVERYNRLIEFCARHHFIMEQKFYEKSKSLLLRINN